MNSTVKLYTFNYRELRTYITAILFVAGNIILPQAFHLLSQGGIVWLPIYFFTLVGAYKYGWKVGLLVAVFSPIINSLLFGMPLPIALPAIILKSVLLAIAAGIASQYFKRVSLLILTLVVLSYQVIGVFGEWLIISDFQKALQDFRLGIPGMLFQIFGGYFFINLIRK